MTNYHGVVIDPTRDNNLSDRAKTLLEEDYLPDGETPQEGFARSALAYCDGDLGLAQRIYDYASKGWFMYASPVLSNAPKPGQPFKGLPISCYLTYADDTLEGLIDEHTPEVRWMSVKGGGVGGHWSDIRAVSDKSPGVAPFLKSIDSDMVAYSQGKTRRGSYAAYLDISHPDIEEFISIRTPTGGDFNRKCFNLHIAVNITTKFLKAVVRDDDWDLIDPNDGSVRDTLKARTLFEELLSTRYRTGEPYLNYIDEANKHLPEALKHAGLKINGSNLCVAGDTKILTDKGYQIIKHIEGEYVNAWNGQEYSNVQIRKTGENKKLLTVTFSDGSKLDCTPEHKFEAFSTLPTL